MIKTFAASAHPADGVGRVSDNECEIGDVACDNGAGANKTVAAKRYAADDRGVCADGGSLANERFCELVFSGNVAARIGDVGEHHARTAENVVFQGNAVVDGYVVLDFYAVADLHVVGNENALAEHAIIADFGRFTDVNEVPDTRVIADRRAGIDDARRMCVESHEKALLEFKREGDAAIFLNRTIRSDDNFKRF